MTEGQKIALRYLEIGLNPIPLTSGKIPLIESHNSVKMTEEEIMEYDFNNIGVSTGIISGGLEVLDFDLKNTDDPKKIMKGFKSKVPKELLSRLVIQQTPSGGYHMIYRCPQITSSKKLAKNSKGMAVIETRGEGGLIKCHPSPSYKLLQGSFDKIPIITEEERVYLFASSYMLGETVIKDIKKRMTNEDSEYLAKFPDFNDDVTIGIKLLEEYGWTIHSKDSVWINFTRPDKDRSGGISGGYNLDGKFFQVFSTSQEWFETGRGYNNHAIYAELVHNGDYKKAYLDLYEQGYGNEEDDYLKKTKEEQERDDWERKLETLTFLSDEIEENTYLEQARKNEIELGLPTGWSELDNYFRIKENSLNVGLGYDGVGKSVFMLSIAAATHVMHGWKWGMIMPENKTGMSRRRLVESMSGKRIDDFKDKPNLFDSYLKDSRESFKIMSNKKHYSIKDVIDMGKRLYEFYGINALLIDPYNFFKVIGNSYSFNNEILSELRVFSEEYCSVYMMAHPSSTAPRTKITADKFLSPPSKYDIQGGADFPYRVDDFFIVHRYINHPDRDIRRTMQFIMEKVKENETGGSVHKNGEWTEMMWDTRNGFTGYWDINGDNPMYKSLTSKIGIRAEMTKGVPEEIF